MGRRLGVFCVVVLSACASGDGAADDRYAALEKRVAALEKATKAKKPGKDSKLRARVPGGDAAKGHIELTGDATRVALFRDGNRFEVPGDVPPGKYKLVARFGEEKVDVGPLDVATGQTVTLACTAADKTCVRAP